MGLSPKSNYEKKIVSCFDIGEVPRSPGKWNWNWLYFLPFIFTFEQGALHRPKGELISKANCQAMDSSKKRTNEFVFTTMQHVFVRFLEESMA